MVGDVVEDYVEVQDKVLLRCKRDILILAILCRMMKLDLRVLLFLYEKYKEDVYFWFFMLSGMMVKFPSLSRLLKVFQVVDDWLKDAVLDDSRTSFYLKELLEMKCGEHLQIDLFDKRYFRFGREGLIDFEEVEGGKENGLISEG